jgi:hypothetical protein
MVASIIISAALIFLTPSAACFALCEALAD